MSSMELSYIAGLFDGEGCVKIVRRLRYGKPGEARKSCEMYLLDVRINNTDPRLIYPLREKFGGSIHVVEHKNSNQRTTFTWIVASQDAVAFLRQIQPWVVGKLEQVDLAIEFQEAKRRWGKPKGGIPSAVRQRERDQFAEITRLKFRTFNPDDFEKGANSGKLQNGQSRAKQGESLGVCND